MDIDRCSPMWSGAASAHKRPRLVSPVQPGSPAFPGRPGTAKTAGAPWQGAPAVGVASVSGGVVAAELVAVVRIAEMLLLVEFRSRLDLVLGPGDMDRLVLVTDRRDRSGGQQ